MKKSKRILAALTSVIMALSMAVGGVSVSADDSGAADIKIGDYFQIGTYMDKPILWRCVGIDENGPLMLSDKILCIKAFDAAGTNETGSHARHGENIIKADDSDDSGYDRHIYGSCYWQDSNIRDWLNSDADAGNVVWSCGNPPDSEHIGKAFNAYDKEAGFLNDFTEDEKSLIKTVKQKQILCGYEYGQTMHEKAYIGVTSYTYDDLLTGDPYRSTPYDEAYSEECEDRVFLLDVKQLNDVYTNLGDYCNAKPTREAVSKSIYRSEYFAPNKTWIYWLRTPTENRDSVMASRYGTGIIRARGSDYAIGVRPAFYLDTSAKSIAGGSGSEKAPYVFSIKEVQRPEFTVNGKTVKVGEYFQMGTYYGDPVLWRCIDIDENGPLMLSDKILCLKAFDAAGCNEEGSHGRGENIVGVVGFKRKNEGSNYWGDSNIRDWLNSDAEPGQINWSCGNPPTEEYMMNGKYNAYDREAGFLNGFTASEKAALKQVTQKQLLDSYEYDQSGNENWHRFNSNFPDILQNYDTAYSETTVDKMFLLDIKQIYDLYNNFGESYCTAYPTEKAVENSEYKCEYDQPEFGITKLSADRYWYYWLRSPHGNFLSYTERFVTVSGNVEAESPNDSSIGVRPAFYLDTASALILSGSGSETAPYVLSGDTEKNVYGDADCDGNVTASDAALVLQKTLTENSVLPIRDKTADWLKYLDVDADGGLTASDAAEIMQKTLTESHLMPAETTK